MIKRIPAIPAFLVADELQQQQQQSKTLVYLPSMKARRLFVSVLAQSSRTMTKAFAIRQLVPVIFRIEMSSKRVPRPPALWRPSAYLLKEQRPVLLYVLLSAIPFKCISCKAHHIHRRQSWEIGGVATPQNLGRGVVGGRGRVVKYYYNLIKYRKYVRKW